jgi:CDP-diacylglycerol--glycerol-3-phosphate 3-phosphatidyltransferase
VGQGRRAHGAAAGHSACAGAAPDAQYRHRHRAPDRGRRVAPHLQRPPPGRCRRPAGGLDAVDGARAGLQGGGTAFGSFLDSTLDRVGEAILYAGIVGWFLRVEADPTLPVLAAILALIGSFMVSYSRARAEGIGVSAAVGLAPRTERLALVIAGVALAGLGWPLALLAILWLMVALTAATVVQRIWHVWNATQGRPAPSTSVSETPNER